MKEKIKIIPSIIIIGALIIGGSIYLLKKQSPLPSPPAKGLVTKVIDGDTIFVEEEFKIRLLGIDADEIGESCYGDAKARLKELVLDKEVLLEKDQVNQDQYKRFLRYIFLDNQNINLQLIQEGLVNSLFYEPNLNYKEEITEAENEAKINKIGCEWTE